MAKPCPRKIFEIAILGCLVVITFGMPASAQIDDMTMAQVNPISPLLDPFLASILAIPRVRPALTAPEHQRGDVHAVIQPDPLGALLQPYLDVQAMLEKELNLELNAGYTLIFQTATDHVERSDSLLSGSYDFVGLWHLLENPAWGDGTLGFLIEGGQIISHNRDEDLSANVGSILGVNDDLDNQSLVMSELWWSHLFFDEAISLTLGKINQTVFFDGNRIANDSTTQFMATPLANNPSVPFPDNGLGVNVTVTPNNFFYISGGIGDALADVRETGFNTLADNGHFSAVELGITPTLGNPSCKLEGTYRLLVWHSEAGTNDGSGLALSCDQEIYKNMIFFFRSGHSDNDDQLTSFDHFISGGIGIEEPFGRGDDLCAIGIAWGNPSHETIVEMFYRLQLTDTVALTPDIQIILNPANNHNDHAVGVFGLRLQSTF